MLVAGLATGLGVGLLVGIFNGFFVSWIGINPFVVTLGSLNICYGLATTISGGRPVFNVPDAFTRALYDGTIAGVPIPVTLAIVVAVLLYLLLDRTVFGRALYLIGNNPRAASLAGLPSKRYLFLAYVTCSLLAAFGSLMLTARTGSGEPNLGGSLMLESIAAAVIGGVSLQGGVGGIVPVILGSVFVTMLSNAMDLLEVGGYVQQILLGCVIIAAIFLDRVRVDPLLIFRCPSGSSYRSHPRHNRHNRQEERNMTQRRPLLTLQIDNSHLRVTEWRFPPGAATGYHRHEHDYVVVPARDGELKLIGP